ncbi:MAG: hypothetical protein KAI66_04505 [Lentisphaeria bacterium]|nr:hypothetical protein [Lentisphaeria bacterium]
MKQSDTRIDDARADAIRAEMDGIRMMLHGTVLANRNRAKRKDGSVQISPEHYTFQYYDMDGKRKCKRIPRNARAAVVRLTRAGERYRALEREYRVLMTERSLADSGKKNV